MKEPVICSSFTLDLTGLIKLRAAFDDLSWDNVFSKNEGTV